AQVKTLAGPSNVRGQQTQIASDSGPDPYLFWSNVSAASLTFTLQLPLGPNSTPGRGREGERERGRERRISSTDGEFSKTRGVGGGIKEGTDRQTLGLQRQVCVNPLIDRTNRQTDRQTQTDTKTDG
ncbi:hypothetical protein ANANG_G00209650, partial [Anguilla anguilla]